MARTANKTTAVAPAPTVSPQAIVELEAAPRALAAHEGEKANRVRAIAAQMGYQLPGDSVDADLIQRDIAANMRRSVEACLEVGRGLAALKEACEHGEFCKRLEILGIEDRVARRFMLSAVKFTKRAAPPVLAAAGSQSKLFELLVLDDDEVQVLADGGKARGVDLTDIECMSHKELRTALKKAKDEQEATKNSLKKRDESIIKLEAQKTALERELKAARGQAPDEASGIAKLDVQALAAGAELARLEKDASAVMAQVDAGLRKDFQDLKNACLAAAGEDGDGRDADGFPVALPNHAQLAMQQALAKVIQAAQVLAADYGIVLPRELQAPQAVAWAAQAEAAGDGWLDNLPPVPEAVNAEEA